MEMRSWNSRTYAPEAWSIYYLAHPPVSIAHVDTSADGGSGGGGAALVNAENQVFWVLF